VRVLSVDLGSKRVGLAVSDPSGAIALPLGVIPARGNCSELARAIARQAKELDVVRVLVGLPRSLDGSENPACDKARILAKALDKEFGLQVELVDERFSTTVAEKLLAESEGRSRPRSKHRKTGRIDAAAAAVLLQGWLDSRTRTLASDAEE
jgi:putative Holliday junction resolvase